MEKKLIVTIESGEQEEYNIKSSSIRFAELERKILVKHAQRALENAARIARKSGLSKMTNGEINRIINETRKRG